MKTINQNIGTVTRPLVGLNTMDNEVIWTNTPGTVRNIRTDFNEEFIDLRFSVKGLTTNNYTVKVSGNLLVLIIERKKEVMKTGSWGKSYYDSYNTQKFNYSVFERSDIFLPGDRIKKLENVKFIDGELCVTIRFQQEEMVS